MTTDPVRPTPDPLEAYFAAARAVPPAVPDGLMARVLADAAAENPVRAGRPAAQPARESLWSQLVAALGGRGALAGMAAAGLAGVWVGFAQPVALPFLPDAGVVELFPADLDLLGDVLATDTLTEG